MNKIDNLDCLNKIDFRTEGFRLTSFVRRGSRLNGKREQAWKALSDKYVLDLPRGEQETSISKDLIIDPKDIFQNNNEIIIEIGTGLGEAIYNHAKKFDSYNHIAIEVYRPGIANLLSKIGDENLENIKIVEANAPEFLSALTPSSVSEIHINFPDPWPKTRHHKKRLVNDDLMLLLAKILKPGGKIRLATDWSNYAEQMRDAISNSKYFQNPNEGLKSGINSPLSIAYKNGVDRDANEAIDTIGGWSERYEHRVLTSFENKANKAGRQIFDLTAIRIK